MTPGAIDAAFAGELKPFDGPFDPGALRAQAEAATGLRDWGGAHYADDRFRARLDALCHSLETEAVLTSIGRTRAHGRVHAALISRLRTIAWHRANPVSAPIVAPLIGTGFPRAGTSFFHELIAQDPDNMFPTSAQCLIPVPPPGDPAIDAERRAHVDKVMELQGLYTPEADAVHPSGPDQPDECILIQASAMGSFYQAFFNVPGFIAQAAPQVQDFLDWEVKVLQALQSTQRGERWALKTPEYMNHWEPMWATFPDARVFINHRDPAKVIPSICSLFATFNGLNWDVKIQPEYIARPTCERMAATMARVTAWRKAHPDVKVVDVHYTNLIADPIGEAERVYGAFGLTLSSKAKQRMTAFLGRNRHGAGVKKHVYTLAEFGLSEAMIEEYFGDYIEAFGIQRETRI